MMQDEKTGDPPPEFEAFTDLTRDLLAVSKEDLDAARAAEPPARAQQKKRLVGDY